MKMLNDMHKQTVALSCAFDSAAPASKASCKSRRAGIRPHARLHTDDEGSSLVEFALVFPFFVAFMMGIFWIGLTLSAKQALTDAVGIAGAQLSQSRGTTANPCDSTLAAIKAAAPQLKPANLSVILNINGVAGSCDASDLNALDPPLSSVTVTANYATPFKIPMFTGLSSPPWFTITMVSFPISATVTEFEY